MRGSERGAFALSATAFALSAVLLPVTYVAVPFCTPEATPIDLVATVGVASLSSALSLAGVFLSLLAVYTVRSPRSRTSLALSTASLAFATAFLVFGLALRTCAA